MPRTKKGGLGNGLESMIPNYGVNNKVKKDEKKEKEVVVKEIIKEVKVPQDTLVDINDIEPNREQPRKNFDKEALEELAESIKIHGLIQPIIVQKKEDYYEIIAGERRWRAAKIAGLKELPVVIKEYTPQEVMEIALIENIQRKDLNPIEEAIAYKSLIDEYNLKQDELAKKMSKSRAAIANSMRLLKLAGDVQQMIINQELSMGHARALLAIEHEELQIDTAKTVIEKGLSVRETEKLVKNILKPKQIRMEIPPVDKAVYTQIQDRLKEVMGTKVSINPKKDGKGKIEIEYYSSEELERLIELFNGISE